MGMQLPAELVDVAAAAGVRWPEADETAMTSSATAWRRAATDLQALGADADTDARGVFASFEGNAAEAARRHWDGYVREDGRLPVAVRECHAAADRLDHGAEQVTAAKNEIVRQLVALKQQQGAAQTAQSAGLPQPLAGLGTLLAGTSTSVAHVSEQLTRAITLDGGTTVTQQPLLGQHGPALTGDILPGNGSGGPGGSGQSASGTITPGQGGLNLLDGRGVTPVTGPVTGVVTGPVTQVVSGAVTPVVDSTVAPVVDGTVRGAVPPTPVTPVTPVTSAAVTPVTNPVDGTVSPQPAGAGTVTDPGRGRGLGLDVLPVDAALPAATPGAEPSPTEPAPASGGSGAPVRTGGPVTAIVDPVAAVPAQVHQAFAAPPVDAVASPGGTAPPVVRADLPSGGGGAGSPVINLAGGTSAGGPVLSPPAGGGSAGGFGGGGGGGGSGGGPTGGGPTSGGAASPGTGGGGSGGGGVRPSLGGAGGALPSVGGSGGPAGPGGAGGSGAGGAGGAPAVRSAPLPSTGLLPGGGAPGGGVSPAPPATAVPGTGQPGPSQPGAGVPSPGQPSPGQPSPGQPSPGQPGTGGTGSGQPGPGQPGTGQPGTGQPGGNQPSGNQPGQGQANQPADGKRTPDGAVTRQPASGSTAGPGAGSAGGSSAGSGAGSGGSQSAQQPAPPTDPDGDQNRGQGDPKRPRPGVPPMFGMDGATPGAPATPGGGHGHGGAGGALAGADRPADADDPLSTFLFFLFPPGVEQVPAARPARQVAAPPEELDLAAGLRYAPGDHPEAALVDGVTTTRAEPLPVLPGRAGDDDQVRALATGHDPIGGQHEREWERRFLVREARPEHGVHAEYAWPPGEVFPEGGCAPDAVEAVVLAPGTVVDRFGDPAGRVFAADATPFPQRSLPPEYLGHGYRRYLVALPLPVWRTVSAAWFGQPGGGVRYRSTHAATDLLALGHLVDITQPESTREEPTQ